MNGRAPYALAAWYPAVRGPARAMRVLGEDAEPRAGDVDAAWAELAPGEALVIVHSPRGGMGRLLGPGRRGRTRRLAARLAGAGRIDRWLVLPGSGGSHVLLPAAREGFVAGLRLLPAGRWRWRAARWVLGLGGRWGLAGRLGLDELLVALKGPAGPPLVPWIRACDAPDLTVALGVPGLLRKAVVLVSGDGGDVHGLLKLSITGASRGRVRHEAETLGRLGELAPETTWAPALLGHGDAAGRAWLAQGLLEGRRSPDVLGAAHFAFLADLHARTATEVDLEVLDVFRAACARIDALSGVMDPAWHGAMVGLRDALRLRLDTGRIPCCLCHGDFTPWNLVLAKGRLMAFDWEFSLGQAPALFDLFHFHFQTGVLVRHVGARRLLEDLDALAAGPARGLLQDSGSEPTQIAPLAGLYVLHAATFDEQVNRTERPPFAQVEWLRRTRTDLARLLQARLLEDVPRVACQRVRVA